VMGMNEEEKNTHTKKIKIDDKGKKTVAGGREMHWLRDEEDTFYSAFFVPDGWDELRKGDTVEVTYERREKEDGRVYRNIQKGGIQPISKEEEEEKKKEERREEKVELERRRITKEEMHAKWAMECASRVLGADATQKDIFEKSTSFLQWFKKIVEEERE